MTDVSSQMEANGLPPQFQSMSDHTTDGHLTANVAATKANAETVGDSAPNPPASFESTVSLEPTESTQTSIVPESQPVSVPEPEPLKKEARPIGTPASDAAPEISVKSATNGTYGVQSSPSQPPQPPPTLQAQESSVADSVVPSSIPTEIPSSSAAAAMELPIESGVPVLEPAVVVDQAPISDLRTAPHSDALAPETVAAIEERKHTEDNAADLAPPPVAAPVEPSPSPVMAESAVIAKSGLPSPPAQSPPPAPEIPHAELPADRPSPMVAAEPVALTLPTETPIEPAPTPAEPAVLTEDVAMEDAPASKAVHGRDEDEDAGGEEPAAKRARTDDESTPTQAEFKVPEPRSAVLAEPSRGGDLDTLADGDDAVTTPRLQHMKKIISNLKKSNASAAFRLPVDHVSLKIPTYPEIVKNPMDLARIDQKLKNNTYLSIKDFVDDFNLIVQNCVAFNGPDHTVTHQAFKMESSFKNQMQHLPPASAVEPSKAEKKAMKLKTEPIRTAPPRRPSVTTPATPTPKSAAAPSTPSFAPGPDGMPLIRRDSSIVDGRPKRAIVPPKRNSDFAGVRPKKKKYELQLRFCQEVLKEISSTKHWQLNQYFTHPVDPVALNIPTYFQIIKKPMDLSTIQTKLDNNVYEKAKDFEEDVRLVFKNCYKFNPEGDYVNQLGHQLEELFDRKWAEKDEWIAAREPQSTPETDGDEEEEADESEEEANDSEDERNEKIKALQAQIEAMSKQMGELTQSKPKKKKPTPPTASTKKSKAKGKKDKVGATFPGLSKSSKETKKKATKSTKAEKDRYVTFVEKQYISNGIAMLPERQMQEALKIIQNSVPALAHSDQNEIELDIEEVPNHALLKLLNFVKKYAGPPPDEPDTKADAGFAAAAPTGKKKNKPMSKVEQEEQIAELKDKLGAYNGGGSPDAMPSVETGNDSSDDSADSEESEEE